MKGESWLPLAVPDLSGNERAYVNAALDSTWISSSGEFLDRFEREFAARCQTNFALTVSNGTVALHLALLGLGIKPGDEVIVPSLTYIATVNAVRYVGAEPVFVDVDPESWCISAEGIEAAVTPRTRAIIVVHLYGHPADMDAISAVTAHHDLFVIEDAAEAHFALYKGKPVGSLSDIATFSFYGNKILTSGEGGAVTANDSELVKKLKMLRGQGMDPDRRYYFPIVGHNFRMTNIAAAFLCAQLERANTITAMRQSIFDRYEERLQNIPGLSFRPRANWAVPAPWLFCLTVDSEAFGCDRDELMTHLAGMKVETRPFFIPIHTLPPYQDSRCSGAMEVTMELSRSGLHLPTHRGVSDAQVDRVCDAIKAQRKVR